VKKESTFVLYLTNVLLNDICSTLADFQFSLERKTIFRKYGPIFFTSSHLCANKIFKARIMQRTLVHNYWQSRNGERRTKAKEICDRFSPQNFRQCTSRHLLTRLLIEGFKRRERERERGKENPVVEGCRVNGNERQRTEREKERDCRSKGRYPAISVKGFGYIPTVRGVSGRAPGDGTVPQLKAIFP